MSTNKIIYLYLAGYAGLNLLIDTLIGLMERVPIFTILLSSIIFTIVIIPIAYFTLIKPAMRDLKEKEETYKKLQQVFKEKELLFKEIHHRIKNNMNTVMSLLSLQADSTEDKKVKEALNDASLRISGMMVIYDKLYASKNGDYDCIRLDYFMTGLIKQFKDSYFASNGIMITEDIDVIELDIKMTQNIGIIVNELLTNIAKYAFPYEEHKKIFISIKAEYNFITICVSDNGIGMPDNFNFDNSEGFGLQLISGLLSSMQGSIRIDREVKGASIIIEFKYKETKNGTSKI